MFRTRKKYILRDNIYFMPYYNQFIIFQGAGEIIPGGATLHFDVELLGAEDGPAPVNVFKQIDSDSDNALSREELSAYLKQQVS